MERAQEKARVMRTERRRSATTGMSYPWVVDGSAIVNHYYFYCVDDDFGPFCLKQCAHVHRQSTAFEWHHCRFRQTRRCQ